METRKRWHSQIAFHDPMPKQACVFRTFLAAEIMFPICILGGFFFFFLKLHKPIDALNNNCTLCRFFFQRSNPAIEKENRLIQSSMWVKLCFSTQIECSAESWGKFHWNLSNMWQRYLSPQRIPGSIHQMSFKIPFFKGLFYPTIKCICESFNKGHCFVIVWNDYMFSGGKDPASVEAAAH